VNGGCPRALALALVLLSCAACGSKQTVLVTPSGRVGPLRVDESSRADVIAFAGKPDSERRGRYDDGPRFDALGYGCKGRSAVDGEGGPQCETVFYLDAGRDRLAILDTRDPRYTDGRGVHPGTPTPDAERRLHMHVLIGCADSIDRRTRTGFLFLWFVAGRVDALIVHSNRLNPGVIDCVDS
jgi:hypothetical protein